MVDQPTHPIHGYPVCGAYTTSREGTCNRRPIKGGRRCPKHGGSAPQVKAAAQRRVTEAEMQRKAASWSLPPVTNPLEALATLAGEAAGWKHKLADMVDELRNELALGGFDKFGQAYEQARVVVDLYVKAAEAERRVLADIGRLKVDERLAAVEERQVELIGRVFDAVFQDLELEGETLRLAKRSVERHVRALPRAS